MRQPIPVLCLATACLLACVSTGCDDRSCPTESEGDTDGVLVKPDGSGTYATIQAAIDAADSADVIELADGVFRGDGNRDISYRGKAITVRSQSGNPEDCVIDCEGSADDMHYGSIFANGETATSVLEGLTVRGAYGVTGSAVVCSDASPTIYNCRFEENRAEVGGAIYCSHASPAMLNCVFVADSASASGGAIASAHGSPHLRDCTFTQNWAGEAGGAIRCFYDEGTVLADLTLIQNRAGEVGGGMSLEDVTLMQVSGCILTENDAAGGGGIHTAGDVSISFTTLAENTAELAGAAIMHLGGPLNVTNCTLSDNASPYAAGLSVGGSGRVIVSQTIIAFASEGLAVLCAGTASIQLTCCDLYGNAGGNWTSCIEDQRDAYGNLSADPLFCDPEQGDYSLARTSPCSSDSCGVIGAWPTACDPLQ